MNSRWAKAGVTRKQGIDYLLLTSYLPFTHQLSSRMLEAGMPVTSYWLQVTYMQASGGGKKGNLPQDSRYKQPIDSAYSLYPGQDSGKEIIALLHLIYKTHYS